MHEPEENPAHKKTKSGKRNHRHGSEVIVARRGLERSAFLQHPAGKQLVQPSAAVSRLDEFFQRLNPFWQCEMGNLTHRLQHLRDVFHVNVSIFQPRRRAEEHTSELQSPYDLVCRLLLEKKK